MKEKCEQRWREEVQAKKTLDLYSTMKSGLKKEQYINDPGDRRGARLKFKFRTRSAGLRAETGEWRNKNESSQCVMCSSGEDENVEHVLTICEAYKEERDHLMYVVPGQWEELDERKKVEILLGCGQDTDEGKKLDSGVKKFLRRVMEKRKRWMSGA